MPAIQTQTLHKTFTTKRKSAGLSGSLRALLRPEWQTVEAVHGISFEMEAVIARLAEAGNLVDVTISDPSLEEVIRVIYEEMRHDE
jgi:ABC-type uncharacterized transport system ATPase subunit